MGKIRAPLAAAVLVAVATLLAPTRRSEACGNEVELKLDSRISVTQLAEIRLEKGMNQQALYGVAGFIDPAQKVYGKDGVERRMWAVTALAIARSQGKYDVRGDDEGRGRDHRIDARRGHQHAALPAR